MLANQLTNLKNKVPLVHSITNYVTANDCANIVIACGGSPIMADEIQEVAEISKMASALNINIGTINERTLEAMLVAGKSANLNQRPIILDPVGIGASTYRLDAVKKLLNEINFTAIKGNLSEIKALAAQHFNSYGVDSSDQITTENLPQTIQFARNLAQSTHAIIIISGRIDIVTNQSSTYLIKNGDPMMSQLSGTGCMLSAMTGAFLGANSDPLAACVASVCAMGVAGKKAALKLQPDQGNLTFKNYLFDEIYTLSPEKLENEARYELFK